ncbi:MAG: hypothetical protein KAQ99_08630 [Candidatus Aureabacteria bacterium]|nr:hypothetical protein [Candidatus Auribacterota bacterium]
MKYPITESMHCAIKEVYLNLTGGGHVKEIAYKLGLPRWKVTRYAIQQGFTVKQKKEPGWTDKEIRVLERCAHLQPEVIQRKLKEIGYQRSAIGIVLKRKRLHLLRSLDGQSARSLALCFGTDVKFVTRAITFGRLKAGRRGSLRTELQGGDTYYIKDKDVKKYIIENVHEIDFRKIAKYWLVSILSDK